MFEKEKHTEEPSVQENAECVQPPAENEGVRKRTRERATRITVSYFSYWGESNL